MLKLRNVKRFGQKLAGVGRQFGRKLSQVAKAAEAIGTPIAGAIAGPEGAALVKGASESAQKLGRSIEKASTKAGGTSERLFKQIQSPVLGAQEILKQSQQAMRNPEQAQIMIGETIARRFPSKQSSNIQRTEMNDWAPDLPFAT